MRLLSREWEGRQTAAKRAAGKEIKCCHVCPALAVGAMHHIVLLSMGALVD